MPRRTVAFAVILCSCFTLSVLATDSSVHKDHSMHHSSINHKSEIEVTEESSKETSFDDNIRDDTSDSDLHKNHASVLQIVPQDNDTDPHLHHANTDSHIHQHDVMNDQSPAITRNDLSKTNEGHKEHLIKNDDLKVDQDGHSHHGHDMDNGHDMNDGGHDHMNMNGNDSDMHGMKMWFHLGEKETILFEQWKVTSSLGMIGSMIGIILLGMFYEGLKYFREYLFKQYISSMQFATVAVTGESGRVTQVHKVEKHRMLSVAHAIQTCLHVVQIIISYFLMLIFMTYNVWLCIAVVLGSGLGYFIFGWKKATVVDITEHCH